MRAFVVDRARQDHRRLALLAAALLGCGALSQGCNCGGAPAPPGTSSFFCTCECGIFVLGNPVEGSTRLTPRFEVCLTPEDMPADRPLLASDVVNLCDDACAGTISSAVREVGCVDRPDLCEQIACADEICRSASGRIRDVFVPEISDAGVGDIPDAALLSFGFSEGCRAEHRDAGLFPCEEDPCALEDVRGVAVCGDGVLQEGEECDGMCNVFAICAGVVSGTHGSVRCRDDCTYDLSGCVALDEDAGPAPVYEDCRAQGEAALQSRVLDVLHACTVVEPSRAGAACAREASAPLCMTR